MNAESFMTPIFPKMGKSSTPKRGTTDFCHSGIVPNVGNNLKALRNARQWTLDEAAGRFGLSRGGYIKIERSERGLGDKHIQKAAKVYGVPAHEVFSEPRIAEVVGYVGAGGEVIYDTPIEGERDSVECPADAPLSTVAVQVRGDSLGPGFNRWYALFARVENPVTENLLGELCVVGTADGRQLIKWLRRGPSGHNLVSGTGAIEEGVHVVWAAKVIDLRPA